MVASITWNWAASRLTAAASGAFLYLVPIIGVAAGALILRETRDGGHDDGRRADPRRRRHRAVRRPAEARRQVRGTGRRALRRHHVGADPRGHALSGDWSFRPQTAMVLRLYPAGLLAIIVLHLRRACGRSPGATGAASPSPRLAGNLGYQILAAYGMETVPASWTGLIFGLEPVFIALFAVLLAGDRLTALAHRRHLRRDARHRGADAGQHPAALRRCVALRACMLVTLSTMGWGIYTVVIRPVSRKYGAVPGGLPRHGDLGAAHAASSSAPDFPADAGGHGRDRLAGRGLRRGLRHLPRHLRLELCAGPHGKLDRRACSSMCSPWSRPSAASCCWANSLTWPLLLGGSLIIAGVAIAQFGPLMRRTRLSSAAQLRYASAMSSDSARPHRPGTTRLHGADRRGLPRGHRQFRRALEPSASSPRRSPRPMAGRARSSPSPWRMQNLVWGIATPIAGMLADRYGSARVLMAGAVIYAIGLVMMAFTDTPFMFNVGGGHPGRHRRRLVVLLASSWRRWAASCRRRGGAGPSASPRRRAPSASSSSRRWARP